MLEQLRAYLARQSSSLLPLPIKSPLFVWQKQATLVSCKQQEVSFSTDLNDLILIATPEQDLNTLFFQRRFCIEDDNKLDLCAKNFMATIELDNMPASLHMDLQHLAEFIEAGLKEGGEVISYAPVSC